jgi:hypothetical protein
MTFGVVAASTTNSINNITPGVLGFLIVAAMGGALVFLLFSMNKQFRKITPAASAPDAGGEEPKTGDETPRLAFTARLDVAAVSVLGRGVKRE